MNITVSSKQKRFLITVFLIVSGSFLLSSDPYISIETYDKNFDFTDISSVYIYKGDNAEYSLTDFDDSEWEQTALPSSWADLYPDYNGICWYRIHFRFPAKQPSRALGIRLGVITDADETYFNGRLIGSSGRIEVPEESAYDKIRLYEIPTELIRPGEDNVLAIRVRGMFTYLNGPSSGSFILGNYSDLLSSLLSRDFLDLFLVVIYFVVAAYFFLFFARRPQEKENLLFALFAFGMGAYFALRSQGKYLIDADFFIAKKIEYLFLSTLVAALAEFLFVYFKKRHTRANYIFVGISGIHFLVFLVSNNFIFWDWYNQYIQIPSWILGVVLCFYALISSLRKERDARLMLYALVILLITMINDIFLNMAVYHFIRLTSYGFVFFVMAIAIILSSRFVRLNREIEDLNRNLEKRVEDRTIELNNTVTDLEAAKTETDNLLQNVQEGIFLLDQNLVIGDHHSRMLETIFEKEELGRTNLVDLLTEVTDKKSAEQTGEFLEIALTKKLSDKRLKMLNPVDEIRVKLIRENNFIEKYVRFNFTRIGEKGKYTHLLGTVQDATEEKLLEKRIKDSEKRAQDEMKLLLGILHLDPDIVRKFLDESKNDIIMVEKKLESAKFTENLHEVLNSVYRSVHSIKGNASVLGLEMFTKQAHKFEDQIQVLFKKEQLTSLELLDLLYSIVGTKDALKQVEDLLGRITGFQNEFGAGNVKIDDRMLLMQTAEDLAARVAARESKEAELIFDRFELPLDGSADINRIKKLLIQLVKNSVSHGIELPAEREKTGKNRKGRITISARPESGMVLFSVKDDGRGLQLDTLRKKAIESGSYTEEQLKAWPRKRLAQLVFTPGLSTKADTSLDTGRGIGLDVVHHEVKQAGGKISFSSIGGKQTMFTIRLPLISPAQN